MSVYILHDRSVIHDHLKADLEAQIFCVGDLDDFFWPHTIWFAWKEMGAIRAIALLYVGMEVPTLLLFQGADARAADRLLAGIKAMLPRRINVHLSPGLVEHFGKEHVLADHGRSHKMILRGPVNDPGDSRIRRLTPADLPALRALFAVAYPHNWFDERMLRTGRYFGLFSEGDLVGAAGVHVYSEAYKVAALGNITTHPEHRRQGIASKLTQALCHDLRGKVDVIGLNVRANNVHAIQCYKRIGFEVIADYDECYVENVP
ncbi:MAG: GNAT family N-acetyltransferase [Flavobacteriales bacterium]